MLRKEEERR
jgi:hypothetical protein